MSVEEEIQEHVEHARNRSDKMVAGTMAIIAAAVAVVTVTGQYLETEELLIQQVSSDRWAYYQAKSIRRFVSETTKDVLGQVHATPAAVQKYENESKRYKKESEEIQKEAQELERESRLRGRQSARVHFGEVFLEIAIVFSSLSILTKRQVLFTGGLVSAAVGLVITATALLV